MKSQEEWSEDDATWKLLEKSERIQAGGRFADDAVRAVKLLPKRDYWWGRFVSAAPWCGVTACGAVAVLYFIQLPDSRNGSDASSAENWVEIEEVAQTEMLSAAVDHLDQFSDQELATLIGF